MDKVFPSEQTEDLEQCQMAKPYLPPAEGEPVPNPMLSEQVYYDEKTTWKHRTSDVKWCCIPISEPSTTLKCPKKEHDLQFIEVEGVPYRCNICQKNMDEFFRCDKCDYDICLQCMSEEDGQGCLGFCQNGCCFKFPCCCLNWTVPRKLPKRPKTDKFCCCGLINLSATETKMKDKVEEEFNEVEGEVSSLFSGLQGDKENQDMYLTKLFEKFDTDNSGTLEIKELQDFLGAYIQENYGSSLEKAVDLYKEKSDKFWIKIFEKIDKDGDGGVSKEEFLDVILVIFYILEKMMLAALQKIEEEAIEKIDMLDGEVSIPFVKRSLKRKLELLKQKQENEETGLDFGNLMDGSQFDFDVEQIKEMLRAQKDIMQQKFGDSQRELMMKQQEEVQEDEKPASDGEVQVQEKEQEQEQEKEQEQGEGEEQEKEKEEQQGDEQEQGEAGEN